MNSQAAYSHRQTNSLSSRAAEQPSSPAAARAGMVNTAW